MNGTNPGGDSKGDDLLPPFRPPFELFGFLVMVACGIFATLIMMGIRLCLYRRHSWSRDPAYVVNSTAYYTVGLLIICDGVLIMSYGIDECLRTWRLNPEDSNDEMKEVDSHWANKVSFYIGFVYSIEFWILKYGFLAYFFPNWKNYGKIMRRYLLIVTLLVTASLFALLILPFTWCGGGSSERQLSPTRKDGRCLFLEDPDGVLLQASLNIGTDILIIILAIFTYITPEQDPTERLGGFFVMLAAILQPLLAMNRLQSVYPMTLYPGTHNFSPSRAHQVWGCLESYTALAAFFIPVLRGWMVECQRLKEKSARRRVMLKAIASKDKWRAAVLRYRREKAAQEENDNDNDASPPPPNHGGRTDTENPDSFGPNDRRVSSARISVAVARPVSAVLRAPKVCDLNEGRRASMSTSSCSQDHLLAQPVLKARNRFSVPVSPTVAGSNELRRSSFPGLLPRARTTERYQGKVV